MEGPAAAVLGPVGGMGVAVWLRMSRVTLRDEMGHVFREFAHARHQGPDQYQAEEAGGNAFHRIENLGEAGAFVKQEHLIPYPLQLQCLGVVHQ